MELPEGRNDFRSTKRNFYWASVTNAAGAGVRVISNGSQNVRATVGVNSISLKVLDYYGGSATGWNEWDGAYGNGRTIKPGDVIEGKVGVRLVTKSQRLPLGPALFSSPGIPYSVSPE